MSMKYKQQLNEEHTIQLLICNIDDKMVSYLCMTSISTFQELLDWVAKFEKLNLLKSKSYMDRSRRNKAQDTRRGKQSAYKEDKGKERPKLILGDNNKLRTFLTGREHLKPATGEVLKENLKLVFKASANNTMRNPNQRGLKLQYSSKRLKSSSLKGNLSGHSTSFRTYKQTGNTINSPVIQGTKFKTLKAKGVRFSEPTCSIGETPCFCHAKKDGKENNTMINLVIPLIC
ncbi:hypothetical protein M5K25_012992 [Dendrobium thyrsiflorum]|uniref:Uncharacterized protein n=1 Tax=Dendrobium thyrsiflorum TaxID=117978 RepID=A0ABD0UZ38_DENTH